MAKKLLVIMMVLVMLAGCKKDTRMIDEEKYNAYLTYYQALLDYENKLETSRYYNIELVCNALAENRYRYDVIINDPKIAMYDVQVLMVAENVAGVINKDVMMPSEGIFSDVEYNMIPYQVDYEKNYVSGFDLSLVSDESPIHVAVMVAWKDKNKNNSYREYFSLVAAVPSEN
jgi:hypothetical protein